MSHFPPEYRQAMLNMEAHEHPGLRDRIDRLRERYKVLFDHYTRLNKVIVPAPIALTVEQKNGGFDLVDPVSKTKFDPRSTVVGVQGGDRCFVYYNSVRNVWVVVQVETVVDSKTALYSTPNESYDLVIYSTSPISHNPETYNDENDTELELDVGTGGPVSA